MQQLQYTKLQQLQAWKQQHPPQCIVIRQVAAPLRHILPARQQLQLNNNAAVAAVQLSAGRVLRRGCSSICNSAAADAGGSSDVVRHNAQAAAAPPAAAPVDITGAAGSSSGGSGSSAGGSSNSSTGSASTGISSSSSAPFSSYSDMYKALHSSTYSNSVGSSPANGSSSSSSSSAPGSAAAADPSTLAAASTTISGSNGNQQPASSDQSTTAAAAAPTDSPAAAATAAGVEDAIRKAQEALAAAESSLSSIHKLRSAKPPNKWAGVLQILRSSCMAAAAGAFLVASHAFGLGWQWAGATLGALGLAARAYQRETVTPAGAAVAAAASLATLGCSLRFGVVMLAYSYTSHKLRQFREGRAVVDYEVVAKPVATPPRDWPEVLCIAAVPTILAIAYGAMAGCLDLPLGSLPAVETWRADLLTLLQGAVLGWYACCCGDSWSRELGEMSRDQPRLLTTLQPVRVGTHGAVTLLGLSGAAAGGLMVGLLFYCAAVLSPTLWVFDVQRHAAMSQWKLIPLGLIAGLFGSLVDSLLGATLQFTGYDSKTATISSLPGPGVRRISGIAQPWVNDNLVNVLASSLTAAVTAIAALRMFG